MRARATALAALVLASCGSSDPGPQPLLTPGELERLQRLGPIGEAPPSPTNRVADDPAAQHLGQALFFDTEMSGEGTISCASCHDPAHGFADPRPLSRGVANREGTRHASTLANAAWNPFQFWDGRADSLWAQPIQAIENPLEGDFTRAEVAHFIAAKYRAPYETLFGPLPDLSGVPPSARPGDDAWSQMSEADRDAVNRIAANVGKALEAYVRRLVSRNSALDRYLAGDESALTEAQLRGAKIFVAEEKGRCIVCHDGPNLSDGAFHNLGLADVTGDDGRFSGMAKLLADPLNGDGAYSDAPGGRLSGLEQRRDQVGQFKTPTLRDVTLRPPYGHNGTVATLEAWIDLHTRGFDDGGTFAGTREGTIRPVPLTAGEKADLLAFLRALEGEPLPRELTGR